MMKGVPVQYMYTGVSFSCPCSSWSNERQDSVHNEAQLVRRFRDNDCLLEGNVVEW